MTSELLAVSVDQDHVRVRRPGELARLPFAPGVTARDAAESVARRSYGRLVALLASRTRDVAGAEDALGVGDAELLVAEGERVHVVVLPAERCLEDLVQLIQAGVGA